MSSDSDSSSTSGSGSRSGESRNEGSGYLFGERGVQIEVIHETRENPPKEVAVNNMPAKAGYEWVATDVRTQYSLFGWSRLLN